MHEDDRTVTAQDEVRLPGQVLCMEPEAEAHAMHDAPHDKLGRRIHTADAPHDLGTSLGGETIHGSLAEQRRFRFEVTVDGLAHDPRERDLFPVRNTLQLLLDVRRQADGFPWHPRTYGRLRLCFSLHRRVPLVNAPHYTTSVQRSIKLVFFYTLGAIFREDSLFTAIARTRRPAGTPSPR